MDHVYLYTDGACSGNPGPGGYCAILRWGTVEKTVSGSEPETTNNRMELRAVIEGLKALKRPCFVTVTSDSKYVCDAVNQRWLSSWIIKGWKKSDGKPVVYCQACGAVNSESAVYCSHCGTKIIHVSESEPQDAEWEEVKDAQYRACEPGDFAEQEETEAPGQDTQQQDV